MNTLNYYDVLQVDPGADTESISSAVAARRREWQPRTGHPKLETRQAAEQMMQRISEAETVLLDSAKRSQHDQHLGQTSAGNRDAAVPTGSRDWVSTTREYLSQGNASQANYAAREATSQQPDNAEAWYLRGMSSAMLNNDRDAEFELSEAIRLAPRSADYHAELGDLYRKNEMWAKAVASYERALALDPDVMYFQVGLALALGAAGENKRSLTMLRKAHEKHPENELVRETYAGAMLVEATDSWSRYHDDSQSILSAAQLAFTHHQIYEIQRLHPKDPDLLKELGEVKALTASAAEVKFHSFQGIGYVIAAEFVSFILMISFFGAGGGGILLGLIFLASLALWPWLFMRVRRMPGWAWQRRNSPEYVRRTGLQ